MPLGNCVLLILCNFATKGVKVVDTIKITILPSTPFRCTTKQKIIPCSRKTLDSRLLCTYMSLLRHSLLISSAGAHKKDQLSFTGSLGKWNIFGTLRRKSFQRFISRSEDSVGAYLKRFCAYMSMNQHCVAKWNAWWIIYHYVYHCRFYIMARKLLVVMKVSSFNLTILFRTVFWTDRYEHTWKHTQKTNMLVENYLINLGYLWQISYKSVLSWALVPTSNASASHSSYITRRVRSHPGVITSNGKEDVKIIQRIF